MAAAFGGVSDFTISYSVKPTSLAVAYALGVLLTFAVVSLSAWRVSRMNIATAIRNLPEPPAPEKRRRRFVLPVFGILFGGLLAVAGISGKEAIILGLGVSFLILSLVPLLRLAGVPERAAKTGAGLALVAWFVLPMSR